MAFDDEPKVTAITLPRDLERLSVDELNDYITTLEDEITRVRADIDRKQAARAGADSFFKS